jgi:enoyl-CoA hydratase/carnithine racemase
MKWGLVPDVTGTQTLRHLLPLDVIKELTYTARILSGTEATAIGLATHVSDTPHEAAYALAREIAGRSPSAIRAAKQLLDAAVTAAPADGLATEARLQKTVIGKPNNVEAVLANLQKREPKFQDPE